MTSNSVCIVLHFVFLFLFKAFQMRPSIIFFDEIDGLAPVRSSRQDQIHRSTALFFMDSYTSTTWKQERRSTMALKHLFLCCHQVQLMAHCSNFASQMFVFQRVKFITVTSHEVNNLIYFMFFVLCRTCLNVDFFFNSKIALTILCQQNPNAKWKRSLKSVCCVSAVP